MLKQLFTSVSVNRVGIYLDALRLVKYPLVVTSTLVDKMLNI